MYIDFFMSGQVRVFNMHIRNKLFFCLGQEKKREREVNRAPSAPAGTREYEQPDRNR